MPGQFVAYLAGPYIQGGVPAVPDGVPAVPDGVPAVPDGVPAILGACVPDRVSKSTNQAEFVAAHSAGIYGEFAAESGNFVLMALRAAIRRFVMRTRAPDVS